jgi:myo-inositol 2-dehydrogenase / D-chiro-inositol 1-dehydrogenase
LAAPYFLTAAGAKAQEAATDKLTIGAIGVGGRGTDIGNQAASLGNLVACADVHLGNAKRFADRHPKCEVYQDYRRLLDHKDIDAVTIGTPDHWHVRIAIDAMKAGKHVYCEKPLTLTLAEGDLICEAVKKYGKVFQVGTQQRSEFDKRFLKAVAIARSGRLGKHLTAVSSVGAACSRAANKGKSFGPFQTELPPAELDWNMWLGQAPKVPFCPDRIGWDFRWWFEYSGGQVTDWGVHHTDIAFWALAGKDGQVLEANVNQAEFSYVDRDKVRDFLLGKVPAKDMPLGFNVVHKFDVDLTLSTGNVIKLVSGPNELLISGENGRIRVNRERLTGKLIEELAADKKATEEIEALMTDIYGGRLPDNNLGHMNNFFQCVKTGTLPVANVFDHVRAVNACHFANIAMLVNRKIRWDTATGQFVGDDDANALRSRKQREPYGIVV